MTPERVEWPTVALFVTIASGFTAVLALHEHLPAVAEVLALGVLAAWYGSFQHELVHGHPTPWRPVNLALGWLPMSVAVSIHTYERTHLIHHHDLNLTDPVLDPESRYVTAEEWAAAGPVRRAYLWSLRTVPGRLVLEPLHYATTIWFQRRWVADTMGGRIAEMASHLTGVAVVAVIVQWSGISPVTYLLGAVWLGLALMLNRSFAEHRAVPHGSRTAVVRAGWFFSVLYLFNNLHVTHHARPGAPWYRLPALHEQLHADDVAARGAGLYRGYWDILRRYSLRPFDTPVHPLEVDSVGLTATAQA